MAYDETLAQRARSALATHRNVGERKMFGGIAFMVKNRMACGIVGNKLMLRVGPARYDELLAKPHVEPMDFTGRPMRGMIYVSAPGTRTEAALRKWIDLAMHVAETSPGTAARATSRAQKKGPPKKKAASKKPRGAARKSSASRKQS